MFQQLLLKCIWILWFYRYKSWDISLKNSNLLKDYSKKIVCQQYTKNMNNKHWLSTDSFLNWKLKQEKNNKTLLII